MTEEISSLEREDSGEDTEEIITDEEADVDTEITEEIISAEAIVPVETTKNEAKSVLPRNHRKNKKNIQ